MADTVMGVVRVGNLIHHDDLFRSICDATSDAIFVKDVTGRYAYINPSCARLFGAPAAAVVGTDDDAWFGPTVGAELRKLDAKIRESGEPFVYEEEHLLEGKRWVFSTSKAPFRDPDGAVIGIIGIARDITATRAEQRAIQVERDVFAAIAKAAPGALVSLTLGSAGLTWRFISESLREVLGSGPGTPTQDAFGRMVAEDRTRLESSLARCERTLTTVREDCRVIHPARGQLWIELALAPVREPDGVVWHGFVLEVTERKHLERELREERDRLRGIAAASPGALFSFRRDASGQITIPYASEAMLQLYGASPEELRANPAIVFERIAPEDLGRVIDVIDASAASMTPWVCEYQICHPTRGRLFAYGNSRPTRDPDDAITWHGVLIDVTEHRRMERDLRSERDRSAGISAASPAALYTFRRDREGRGELLFASVAMTSIYGATPEEMRADSTIMASRILAEDRPRVFAAIATSAAEMTRWQCEWRILHPERGVVWVAGHSTPVPDGDGAILWHGVLLDITERVQIEAEVRAERDRLAILSATAPGTIYTYREKPDGDYDFPFVAPTVEEVYGLGNDEIRDRPALVFERIHPDDLPGVTLSLAAARQELRTWQREFRVTHPVKGEVWIQCRSRPMRGADGALYWHGVLTDVTDRRRADEKIRESEATLRGIVAATPDFMILIGRDLRIKFINHLLFGFRMEDVVGSPALDLLVPESRDAIAAALVRVFATGETQSVEAGASGATGESLWFTTRCSAVREGDAVIGAVLISTDITPRRRAELALAESDRRHRTLVDLLPDAMFVNTRGRITYCNAAFVRMTGAASADEVIGRPAFDLFHPDDHATIKIRMAAMQETGAPAPPAERTLVCLDGTHRPVSVVAGPVGEDFVVVVHDLTERHRTQRLLASVLESVSDAILTIDATGVILSCNPATTRLFGFAPDELIGGNVAMLMPAKVAREHDGYLARALGVGKTLVIGEGREVSAQRKDGSTFPVELSVSSFRLNGKVHFTGVVRDITGRKRLEEQFRQAHKMEAFGQLAGGVAHDFNNVLTVILGATQSLAEVMPTDGGAEAREVRMALADIYDAGERAASLTRQLLAFSRKTVLEPRIIDVNASVRELQKMLGRLIGEDVLLTTHLVPNLAHVNVDPGQLLQVLMNLAVNARDAMPRGGHLEIETADRKLDEASASALGLQGGAYVEILVRDSGSGMTEEVLARLFQPFFTTKGVGKGTGLGLAVVHGIVTQSGGAISVESRVGHGTAFRIVLPAVLDVGARPGSRQIDVVRRAGETVLVVEDDDMVRRLAVRALTARGYQVLVASNGEAALQTLASATVQIDLVVTDVVMPKVDGAKLGETIRARYPAMRILYVSGYTDEMITKRGILSEQVDFLAKPYTPTSLSKAVADVLSRGEPD